MRGRGEVEGDGDGEGVREGEVGWRSVLKGGSVFVRYLGSRSPRAPTVPIK